MGDGNSDVLADLRPYLRSNADLQVVNGIAVAPGDYNNPHTRANAAYFDNPDWATVYFNACHRDNAFEDRWRTAAGSWDDKVVVDVGCGPGNLFATMGGRPKTLIGVDVSPVALQMAKELGYIPVRADAHDLPFVSGFADLVALNATLHHCTAMATVLAEAARLVRPGGVLICDHDPQLTAWDWRGVAMLLYRMRLPLYRMFQGHAWNEQIHRMASEIHHRPGRGVTPALFTLNLGRLDFDVRLYPHNNGAGAETFDSIMGRSRFKYRIGQRLSGIDPDSVEGALSLMCVAVRGDAPARDGLRLAREARARA